MSLFSNLLNKVLGVSTPIITSSSGSAAPSVSNTAATPSTPATAAVPPTAAKEVDVAAVLDGLAAKNSEDLDWKRSIVDLMKLVGMDSSLSSRKELATELSYPGDAGDSAAMNVWLHKEVLKKFAENGGKVPADLLD